MLTKLENRDQILERVRPLLSDREAYALTVWQGSEQPQIAPSLNVKLFALFLNGHDCEEIRRLNPAISLGQVVAARIDGDWDQRRANHLDSLLTETSARVQQVTLETASFICDILAVAKAEHGDKLKRYMQTGDIKELGEFKIDSISNLKAVIEILQKLTGQERQSTVRYQGEVAVVTPGPNKVLNQEDALKALRMLNAIVK